MNDFDCQEVIGDLIDGCYYLCFVMIGWRELCDCLYCFDQGVVKWVYFGFLIQEYIVLNYELFERKSYFVVYCLWNLYCLLNFYW